MGWLSRKCRVEFRLERCQGFQGWPTHITSEKRGWSAAPGQATETQLEVMIGSLQLFCDASGQKVNKAKSPIFLSPNVSSARARQLSSTRPFNWYGKSTGKLVLGRLTRISFSDIVDKVNKKFSGWKAKSLCGATLVQSLTSTIPQYKMQTMALPAAVCSEEINRKFLWGDRAEQKKGLPC